MDRTSALSDLQHRPEVTAVRVFKQQGDSWHALPPASTIFPPFDINPEYIFRRWGDGAYRFVVVRHNGKFSGSRVQSVIGFGAGEPLPRASSPSDSYDRALEYFRKTAEIDKLRAEVDARRAELDARRRR